MGDILHQLRGMDFNSAVRRSLQHLDNYYGGSKQAGIPGIGEELNEQIIEEIIFQQRGRSGYNKTLNCLQEIQLLEIFIQYFKGNQNEWATNGIFGALFGCSPLPPYRLQLLQKFVSMAIGLSCPKALNSAAMWMQAQGCGSDVVMKIAQTITDDYCVMTSGDAQQPSVLAALPDLSNHFTCNFIAAISHIYHPTAYQSRPAVPSVLLHLITSWLSKSPQLCLFSLFNAQSPYLQSNRTALWTSPTKPNTQTPVPGLFHWCASAPLLLYAASNSPSKDPVSRTVESDTLLWSKLHLALLECIVGFSNIPGASRLELLTLDDMNRIIKGVCGLLRDMPADLPAEIKETAVDRMVQILQVSLARGAFRCSLADLKNIVAVIPENRLLHALAQQHLSIAPPQMHNERP